MAGTRHVWRGPALCNHNGPGGSCNSIHDHDHPGGGVDVPICPTKIGPATPKLATILKDGETLRCRKNAGHPGPHSTWKPTVTAEYWH